MPSWRSTPTPEGITCWSSPFGPLTRTVLPSMPTVTLPGTGVAGDAGIVVNVMAPADGRVLALSPLTLAALQGYRLDASRVEDLGDGVAAHLEHYVAPGGSVSLLVVWWDWPVRSPAGPRHERIIIERLVPLDATTRDDDLLRFARALAGSMIHEASAPS